MRSLVWVVGLAVICACGSRLEHDPSMVFGDVALGQSRGVALQLTNRGSAPLALTFALSGDFAVEQASRTLRADETSTLIIRFSPTDLGPRVGTLTIRGPQGVSQVALSGRGTGARLSAPAWVTLPPLALVTGEPARASTSTLVLRNTGTAGSLLTLGPPRVDGTELCVGSFLDTVCQPWTPPASLDTQTLLEVPLSLLATTPGARQWSVVFPSSGGEVSVEVVAVVEAFEPCVFSGPAEVVLGNPPSVLRLTHSGPGTCLVRELRVRSTPAGFLLFGEELRLPARLESGMTLTRSITLLAGAPLELSGIVHVEAAGTAPLDIAIRREPTAVQCLQLNPSTLDFGTVPQDCNSPNRNVQLYNVCATPLTVVSTEVVVGAGEGPGGPNCPGTAPCPEFFLVRGVNPGTVLPPGSTPLTFTLKYRPLNYGPDTGVVRVTTLEEGELVLSLQGRGDSSTQQVDTYRQDGPPGRLVFYLTSRPADPRELELRIDGRAVPDTDWTLDVTINAVVFVAGREPAPGETLQISYGAACFP